MSLAVIEQLSASGTTFLVIALTLALAFEFVNGFHDTANAVATVIYTHALPPRVAVVWSGLCNLAGVLVSSGAVAYSILALLPVELVINVGSGAGFAMIFSLLLSAILWNVGTWALGLPASSSQTLIGSILGVGLAHSLMAGHGVVDGLNWSQVYKVFLSLLLSPVIGFGCAAVLLLLLKAAVRDPSLFRPPLKDAPPPRWIRGTLLLTCTGVSFAHGSNDGQKGMGLILLILIGILPAEYALNLNARPDDLRRLEASAALVQPILEAHAARAATEPALQSSHDPDPPARRRLAIVGSPSPTMARPPQPTQQQHGAAVEQADELAEYLRSGGKLTAHTFAAVAETNRQLADLVRGKRSLRDIAPEDRKTLRTDLFLVDQTLGKLVSTHRIDDAGERELIAKYHGQLDDTTKYLPTWVKVAVALALGCGTMVGWRRIVVTVGEKIGKEHLNYGQGAAAEVVAMLTIGAADFLGLPVSTTHVLSSGVAGTMAANGSGVQLATVRNVVLAWVLTLPVCVLLGAGMFSAGLFVVFNHLVPQTAVIASAVAIGLLIAWRLRRRPPPAGVAAG